MAEQMKQEATGKAIPAGYKQTEVGVIPEDWSVVSLQDICSIIDGDRGINYPTSTDFQSYGYCGFLSAANVTKSGFVFDELAFITQNKDRLLRNGKLVRNDIVLTTRGTVGNFALYDNNIPFDNLRINSGMVLIRLSSNSVDVGYLYCFLRSSVFFSQIERMSFGSAQPQLTVKGIQSFYAVCSRNKQEQTAIANVLSDSDALIDALEQLIAKKQAIKSATMQQLLTGRTRLPAFALRPDGTKKGYKPSELGDIPEDWEVVSLGDASQFINGRAYALHEWESSGVPVIRLQNLTGRGDEYYYSNLQLPERQYCDFGDLLFMWSATFGPVIWKGSKAIYHYHIWKIECKSGNNKAFLFYLLGDMTERLKNSSSSGGTMLHVTKEKMESTKSIFPSIEEQTAIATILSDMDNELQALTQKLEKARALKQGMMQQLLTGKIRLPLAVGA